MGDKGLGDKVVIGTDEALKGDTFGGVVVAGVKANGKTRKKLKALGVADSKLLTEKKINQLAPEIERLTGCMIKNIYPDEYNSFKGNFTELLDKLHSECYDYLKPGIHVVDKYPGCGVGDIVETKAETKYIEVAAASILARHYSLKQFNDLSNAAGFRLPMGSTHVSAALGWLKKSGLPPIKFVKLSFRNVREVFR